MKKTMLLMLTVCLLLTGCGKSGQADANSQEKPSVETEAKQETGVTVKPLADTTMDSLNEGIFAVSLEEGGAYVDDTGKMQMHVKVYSYDKYDLADIADLKAGDTIVTHAGDVKISALERSTGGAVIINGGLEAGGFELVTDESTVFYESGFNDAKNWYEVSEATIRVNADFVYYDRADPAQEKTYYAGSFLIGEVTDYHFTPDNTTIRVENGQIVEMNRIYVP